MTYIDGSSLSQILGTINSSAEMQAIFIAGLCCLGAWMLLSWMIQIIRSILWIWPLLLAAAVLIAVPSLRLSLTQEIIPQRMDDLLNVIDKNYKYYNNTLRQ